MEEKLYPEIQVEEFIQNYADKLTEREKDIVRLRFGLLNGKPCTFYEIGMIMDMTPDRVRYLESKIIRKCRGERVRRSKKISEFYN